MHSRYLFILVGFLFYTSQTMAQAFEPGVLVRSTGDTLRGEVENGFWVQPPTFIRFRRTPASAPELFKPRQLRSVSFYGGRFFRFMALPIDQAAQVNINDLHRGNHPDIRVDSLLAEVLVDGAVSLFRVVTTGTTHYLLLRAGQPVLDLSERKYLQQTAAGSWAVTDGNNFRNQLPFFVGDCPAAAAAARTESFTAAGLTAVVQTFNEACSPARQPGRSWLNQAVPRQRMSFQGGMLAGIGMNYFTDVDREVPHAFAGLYTDIFMPSRISAIYGELSVSRFHFQKDEYIMDYQSQHSVLQHSEFGGWLGTARIGLRFFFPLPHEQQWLFGVGYEWNEPFGAHYTTTKGGVTTSMDNEYLSYASPTILPHVGLGWRRQRLTLSVDEQMYKTSAGGINGAFVSSNITLRIGLSYQLGRSTDVARQSAKQ